MYGSAGGKSWSDIQAERDEASARRAASEYWPRDVNPEDIGRRKPEKEPEQRKRDTEDEQAFYINAT